MKSDEPPRSLKSLEEDIVKFQGKTAPKQAPAPEGMHAALRTGLELVSGVLVGLAVGGFLDKWLGTSPVLLILCLFLGAGGGFLTSYRTMKAMERDGDPTASAMPVNDEDDA